MILVFGLETFEDIKNNKSSFKIAFQIKKRTLHKSEI